MVDIVENFVKLGVWWLVVVGGEILGVVVDCFEILGFFVGVEIVVGVLVLCVVGVSVGDMLLVLKFGNFGGFVFFVDVLGFMC